MKSKTSLLLLILMTVSLAAFAEDTNPSLPNRTLMAEKNLTGGIPDAITNTIFKATAFEPHGMLISVTYERNYRCDSSKFATNGCIVAEVAGPQSTTTSPHWIGPRRRDIFKVSLRDESGVQASFMHKGQHLANATSTVHSPLYNTYVLLFSGTNDPEELIHFAVDDVFFIRHSGSYELQLTPQLCWCSNLNAETFYLTNLPPVKLKIPLKSNVPAR